MTMMCDENSNNLMAMVNHLMNVKDSRWLQLEVCREYQRGQCSRTSDECKFAHPPSNVEVQNGRITACYDSIKGRCNRENPKCKYFHPPQHLKDQLLINGKNNLTLKNLLLSQLGAQQAQAQVIAPMAAMTNASSTAYTAATLPGVAFPLAYINPNGGTIYNANGMLTTTSPDGIPVSQMNGAASPVSLVALQQAQQQQLQQQQQAQVAAQQAVAAQQVAQNNQTTPVQNGKNRPDRMEALQQQAAQQQQQQQQIQQQQTKRQAIDVTSSVVKGGLPVAYQPVAAAPASMASALPSIAGGTIPVTAQAYHQYAAMAQAGFPAAPTAAYVPTAAISFTGHPTNMPRF